MNYVGLHGRGLIEPTLRYCMLTIIAVTLLLIATTLVGSENKVRFDRIPVAHLAIRTGICLLIGIPQSFISYVGMRIDDITHGLPQP